MAAITSITAKLLILVDAILDKWVTVDQAYNTGGACNIVNVYGGMTGCGDLFVEAIQDLVYFAAALGANFLPAFGVAV